MLGSRCWQPIKVIIVGGVVHYRASCQIELSNSLLFCYCFTWKRKRSRHLYMCSVICGYNLYAAKSKQNHSAEGTSYLDLSWFNVRMGDFTYLGSFTIVKSGFPTDALCRSTLYWSANSRSIRFSGKMSEWHGSLDISHVYFLMLPDLLRAQSIMGIGNYRSIR